MTNEKTKRAQLAARKLQILHGGDSTDLVLADFHHMKLLSDLGKIGSRRIMGILVQLKDNVIWAEVYDDHGLRSLTTIEIARDMRRDHDPDTAHYAPDYRAASTVAIVADTLIGYRGPVHMGERVVLDSSVPGTRLNYRWTE
jgi:hypothetical protein